MPSRSPGLKMNLESESYQERSQHGENAPGPAADLPLAQPGPDGQLVFVPPEVPSLGLRIAFASPPIRQFDEGARRHGVESSQGIVDDGQLLGAVEGRAEGVAERPSHEHRARQSQPEREVAQDEQVRIPPGLRRPAEDLAP